MRYRVIALLFSFSFLMFSEEKPRITSIIPLPSEIPVSPANCTTSRSGYLEKNHHKMTEAEVEKFVTSSLRDGYVLTIYPKTKSGIFVNMECTALPVKDATNP